MQAAFEKVNVPYDDDRRLQHGRQHKLGLQLQGRAEVPKLQGESVLEYLLGYIIAHRAYMLSCAQCIWRELRIKRPSLLALRNWASERF